MRNRGRLVLIAALLVASSPAAALAAPSTSPALATVRAQAAGVAVPAWIPVTGGAQPPPRGAMAYDSIREQTVLFVPARCGAACGGSSGPGSASQTWVFDGASRRWSRTFPATNPPLIDASATFDPAAGVVVLIGGTDDYYSCSANPTQMWTWDGQNWAQQHPARTPDRCSANASAYDAPRHRIVLVTEDESFGGSETWLWDGVNWTDAGVGPTAGSTIAYDSVSRRVISFGGSFFFHGDNFFGDTSAWNGTRWVTLAPGGGRQDPSPRGGAAMTFDPLVHGVVMFGGTTYGSGINYAQTQELNDTWRWDRNRWVRVGPESSPPATGSASFVYDAGHHVGVLHENGTWLFTTVRAGGGYLLCGSDGGVLTVDNARFYGSMGAKHLNQPIVGIARTVTRKGYWLAASDGGIFAFGDARFHGSTGAMHLNQPIVAMASTSTGAGYWLVARDGGVFRFGAARFHGSAGGMHLNQPIVGIAATPTGNGYRLVARDGNVYAFGAARSYGALSGAGPVVAIMSSPRGNGYWLVTDDGLVKAFGDAPPHGSVYGLVNNSIVAAAPT